MFETQFREHRRFHVSSGSPVADVFSSKFDKDGRLVVFKSGETNLNAFIQSFKDSVNLDLIVERFQNGDTAVLNKRSGFFYDGEFALPGNLLDCLNLVNQGRADFDKLPADVRAKFNHDFGQYLAEFGTPEFSAKLGVASDVGGDPVDPPSPDPAADPQS